MVGSGIIQRKYDEINVDDLVKVGYALPAERCRELQSDSQLKRRLPDIVAAFAANFRDT